MSPALTLLAALEDLEIPHAAYVEHLSFLRQRIQLAKAGFAPRIEWILGPSRVGKSMLIESLKRENPSARVDGRRRTPVVVAEVPPGVSPQHLPGCVLEGLGMPIPPGNVGKVRKRMFDQLAIAETVVILFDEASHIVDDGTKVAPRTAADFFKSLAEKRITLGMFGVPRLRVLATNEQLRLRSSRPREFGAYDCRMSAERAAFLACVVVCQKKFEEAGWPIGLSRDALFAHCYLHTGGLVGVLIAFMRELATQRMHDQPRTLTLRDCQAAAACVEPAGDPRWPAFTQIEVAPAHLHRAHSFVLESNLMSIRDVSTAAQVSA